MKNSTSSPIFFFLFIISSASFISRIFFGIDFTDEFQHYLQVKSLIENKELFENDLFFQQVVYLLIYPVLALYKNVYGFENFLLFGRVLLSLIALSFFVIIYTILKKNRFSSLYASITSASIILSSITIGVFSINYNSITFLFFSLFMSQFLTWRADARSIIITPVFSIFANPFIALIMFGLTWLRLLTEGQNVRLLKIIIFQIMFLGLVYYLFSPYIDGKLLLTSIEFTRDFDIGNALFGSKPQLVALGLIGISYVLTKSWTEKNLNSLSLIYFLAFIFFFLFFGLIDSKEYKIFNTLTIAFLALTLMTKIYFYINEEHKKAVGWFILATLLFSLTFALSSSNGLNQIFVPLGIASIIIFFFDLKAKKDQSANYVFLLIPLLILLNTLFDGYREKGAIFTDTSIQEFPELRYIRTTHQKHEYLIETAKELSYLKDRKVTFIGNKPINYVITDSNPETCMIFMRDNINLINNNSLRNCLKLKDPEYVVTFLDHNKNSTLRQEFFPLHIKCYKKATKAINYELCRKREF